MVNVGFGMNEPHTIERECTRTVRRIVEAFGGSALDSPKGRAAADETDAIVGEALSRWGMYVMQKEIERFSRILEAIENPDSVLPFSWNKGTAGVCWYVYYNALIVTGDNENRFTFASQGEAVEWILNNRNNHTLISAQGRYVPPATTRPMANMCDEGADV